MTNTLKSHMGLLQTCAGRGLMADALAVLFIAFWLAIMCFLNCYDDYYDE